MSGVMTVHNLPVPPREVSLVLDSLGGEDRGFEGLEYGAIVYDSGQESAVRLMVMEFSWDVRAWRVAAVFNATGDLVEREIYPA